LTAHPSNTVYVNFEQSAKRRSGQLSQESIDRAFANRQRRTNYVFAYRDTEIAILSGKQTGRLGVIKKQTSGGDSVDVTNIERTLVDIAVRPDYSGGAQQVLDAYRLTRPAMSVDDLLGILKGLDYIYPYHQAIGFYLQRAGYENSICERMKQFEFKYDFYLAHNMGDKVYNAEWRLFHPKGLA
jgi:hypothetical protein